MEFAHILYSMRWMVNLLCLLVRNKRENILQLEME